MRFLLDTHVLLWSLADDRKLPPALRKQLSDRANEVYCSAASLWEIAIRLRLGREDFQVDPREIAEMATEVGFTLLPITAEHAVAIADLPTLHGDPFDRMLFAQAKVEPMRLLTADRRLADYGDPVELIT